MLNHNCEPNLTTLEFLVVGKEARARSTEVGMPNVPRVGFFARRHIRKGEELSIDYSPNSTSSTSLRKVIKCECGSTKCKGWLF